MKTIVFDLDKSLTAVSNALDFGLDSVFCLYQYNRVWSGKFCAERFREEMLNAATDKVYDENKMLVYVSSSERSVCSLRDSLNKTSSPDVWYVVSEERASFVSDMLLDMKLGGSDSCADIPAPYGSCDEMMNHFFDFFGYPNEQKF